MSRENSDVLAHEYPLPGHKHVVEDNHALTVADAVPGGYG